MSTQENTWVTRLLQEMHHIHLAIYLRGGEICASLTLPDKLAGATRLKTTLWEWRGGTWNCLEQQSDDTPPEQSWHYDTKWFSLLSQSPAPDGSPDQKPPACSGPLDTLNISEDSYYSGSIQEAEAKTSSGSGGIRSTSMLESCPVVRMVKGMTLGSAHLRCDWDDGYCHTCGAGKLGNKEPITSSASRASPSGSSA